MPLPLCIYHRNCTDGLTAAAIVKKALGDVRFHAAQYGEAPPEIEGGEVYIVDFSYPPEGLLQLLARAERLVLLDHHKSAEADLRHFTHPTADIIFDMTSSGAGLAWNYFFPSEPMPRIVAHVEDRDLWRFALPGSREVHHVLSTLPQEVDAWMQIFGWDAGRIIEAGSAMDTFFNSQIDKLEKLAFEAVIDGVKAPVCNAPHFFASELAGRLAAGKPFAGVFSTNGREEFWSLRSRGDEGMDVSEVARRYGGGGHRNAAGFRIPAGTLFNTGKKEK